MPGLIIRRIFFTGRWVYNWRGSGLNNGGACKRFTVFNFLSPVCSKDRFVLYGVPKGYQFQFKISFQKFCFCFVPVSLFFSGNTWSCRTWFSAKNKPPSFLGNFLHKSLVAIYSLYISYLNNAEHLDLISFVLVYVFKKPLIYVKLSLV